MSFSEDQDYICPVSAMQNVLMGKWKFSILWILSKKTMRFGELQKVIPTVSRGVLTQQLRELEHYKIIHREVYNEVPPRVEYSLTEIGKSFIPIMVNIMEWGVEYIKEVSNYDMNICISSKFNCVKCYEILESGEFRQND